MSAKSRAIGDTENEFQAALATYTKAGNKTAAMRRLWNAAYEIGKMAAEAAALRVEEERLEATRRKESNRVEEERIRAFTRGKAAGFEAGRDAALTADALEVSFASGKIAGRADGVEIGRETEGKRWRDAGHSEDGTCRKLDELYIAASTPSPFPTHVPGVFDWADDAESLPIHTVIRESDHSDIAGFSGDHRETIQNPSTMPRLESLATTHNGIAHRKIGYAVMLVNGSWRLLIGGGSFGAGLEQLLECTPFSTYTSTSISNTKRWWSLPCIGGMGMGGTKGPTSGSGLGTPPTSSFSCSPQRLQLAISTSRRWFMDGVGGGKWESGSVRVLDNGRNGRLEILGGGAGSNHISSQHPPLPSLPQHVTRPAHALHARLLSWFLAVPAAPFGVHRVTHRIQPLRIAFSVLSVLRLLPSLAHAFGASRLDAYFPIASPRVGRNGPRLFRARLTASTNVLHSSKPRTNPSNGLDERLALVKSQDTLTQ
ncbi:hypothetical protein DFH08DRAFT_966488 [Mycena albidolilacea]|uniref:Uncharacterized protein n=1 Tax=Mycena albidolilacea TaxID=1033008 RepID=A0AAD6ZNU6_9AGAR|nr:hypothetical protein DFH08DRAFT_966488 [Mycena albidolilacea]